MAAKAGKDGGEEGLMTAAEMKPLLHLARRKPVNCAIAMSKDKTGIILLHRKTRSKKLLAELKAQAKAKGIVLDLTSVRFGRVSVDGASDSGLATFTVNKPAPGPMKRALLEQVRPAGLQRCEIVVDEGLEDEADEDGPDEGTSRPAPPRAGGGAQGNAGPDAPTGAFQPGVPASGAAAPVASPRAPATAGTGMQEAASPATPAAADPVRARLASLGLRARDALASGSPQADGIQAAAAQARAALASGDMAAAGQSADTMERLLGTGPSVPAAGAGAEDAAPVPAVGRERGDAGTSSGPPGARPDQAASLKAELLEVARRIAAADPADRRRLVGLGNDARAAIEAGDTAQATAGIEALRQALPAAGEPGSRVVSTSAAGGPPAAHSFPGTAPARPSQDGEQPGFAAAALRAGLDSRAGAAPDRTRWTQVADGTPGNRATDAGPAQPLAATVALTDAPATPAPAVPPQAAPQRGSSAPQGEPLAPLAAGQPASAQPAPGGGFMDTARSYVGTLGTNVAAGALGVPSALAHAADWAGHRVGVDLGLQDGLHSIRDPSSPNQPLFPTPAEAHEMAYNTTGVTEYVPETRAGRVVQAGLEGVLGGGVGGLATAPVRLGMRMTLSGTVRGAVGAATVGGVGGATGQTAYEAAPDGYKEGAAVVAGLASGLAAGTRGAMARRLGPGGRGSPTPPVQPPAQAPVVPDAVPPPITMQGAENPRPPPAGMTAAYGPATGNVPQATVTGSSRVDLAGTPARPPEPVRLAPPPEPSPPTAQQQLEALPGHGHVNHGTQTTLAQQETRLRTETAPNKKRSPTNNATRFDSHEAELDAVTRGLALVQARDRAGLLSNVVKAYRPGDARMTRLPTDTVVVTGFPGGYGSGLKAQGKGATRSVSPTGQCQNARVQFELDPSKGGWRLVTQFPTNEPVTPFPP